MTRVSEDERDAPKLISCDANSACHAYSYGYCWVYRRPMLLHCILMRRHVDVSAPSAADADRASHRTIWYGVHVSPCTISNVSSAAFAASNCRLANNSTSSTTRKSSVKMTSLPANFRRQQVPVSCTHCFRNPRRIVTVSQTKTKTPYFYLFLPNIDLFSKFFD